MPAKRSIASSAEGPQYRLTPRKWDLLKALRRLRARRKLSSRSAHRELSAALEQLPKWQREHLTTLLECGFAPFRLMALPAYLDTLTREQNMALQKLTDALRWLQGAVETGIEKRLGPDELAASLKDEHADHTKAALKAIRAGLRDHPLMKEWIGVQRALGARPVLRRAKMGLEKGVRLPYPEPSEQERTLRAAIRRLRKKGMSLRSIHQRLQPQRSWPAFHKWCARRGIRGRPKSPPSS